MPSLASSHAVAVRRGEREGGSLATSNEVQGTSLLESFRIQRRVLGALFMREILTRYGRHNIGFLWLFAEPMIFTIGVTILFNINGASKGAGISVTAFVLTGYSTLLLWRNMPSRCTCAMPPNFSLLFHRQVKPLDIYLTRLGLEVIAATTSFTILAIVFNLLGLVKPPYDQITLWSAWLLLAWCAASVSLIIGTLSEHSEVVEKLWHPAMYLLIPLSGSFFMVESLPPRLRDFVLWNPTVHCAEMFRAGYFGPGHIWHYDIMYVVTINMVLTIIGLSMVRGLRVAPTS
jgi:capsular polysaccharide transport system permease protein